MNKKERYQLMKSMLYQKFDGRCAFCGYELLGRWHVFDIMPTTTIVTWKGDIILGDDSYENRLPACISCNSSRIHGGGRRGELQLSIEQFRQWLYHEFDFMANRSMTTAYYQRAKRYGWLEETGKPIVFYFETSSRQK
jgi:hypothetical protein